MSKVLKVFKILLWERERYWKQKRDMTASATSLVFDDLRKCLNNNEVLARMVHFWKASNQQG